MLWSGDQLNSAGQEAMLTSLKLTASSDAEPHHFLIAFLQHPDTPLNKACHRVRQGANLQALVETLAVSARSRTPQSPPDSWSPRLLTARAQQLVSDLVATPEWKASDDTRREALVAAAALGASIPRVQRVFDNLGMSASAVAKVLQDGDSQLPRAEPFDQTGNIVRKAFNASGKAILNLMEAEGKGLGLQRIGTPLLLFAFVAKENGLLDRALRLQAVDPTKLHECLLLNLRSLGNNRLNPNLALHLDQMQPGVVHTLEHAADLARERGLGQIGEPELLHGLLKQHDLFVESNLSAAKVKFDELSSYIFQRHSGEEPEVEAVSQLPTIEEVENRLRQRVVGQDHAIDTIMPLIKRMRFGYTRENRPLAVLLFLGTSGTGKTQLAKEIARTMFGSEDNLIFMEMGQFGTENSKTIFIGAPPGLVGYGQGLLTNGIRDKPESVVLFDEVEKAHPSVFDVLLRFLDEGQIADPAGPVRDGRKCLIVLTSNHAIDALTDLIDKQSRLKGLPPSERDYVRAEVRQAIMATQFFRPEFLNRVDDLVLFNNFDAGDFRQILTYQFEHERERLWKEKRLEVSFETSLVDELVQRCVRRSDEGARVCGKLIGDIVLSALIDFFIHEANHDVRAVNVSYGHGRGLQIAPTRGRREDEI